jgi:acyl-coenzyme A synthetase/AMP-(fatty) acid ligase
VGIDEDGLTKTKAFIVLRSNALASQALADELQEHVKTTLARYKYPRVIEFIDDLPKNDRGKVDKKALRARGSS